MGLFTNIINWIQSLLNHPTPPVPPPLPPPMPTPTPPPSDIFEQIKRKLLLLHNDIRNSHGLVMFTRKDELDRAAQKHNDYMVAHHNLTHDEFLHSLEKRISEEGYRWSTIGENIAEGQNSPAQVMDSWMHSPGHRANILNRSFQDIGFGVTCDSNGIWWWTVDFGRQEN
jgi:uncharacterized protein YkwD